MVCFSNKSAYKSIVTFIPRQLNLGKSRRSFQLCELLGTPWNSKFKHLKLIFWYFFSKFSLVAYFFGVQLTPDSLLSDHSWWAQLQPQLLFLWFCFLVPKKCSESRGSLLVTLSQLDLKFSCLYLVELENLWTKIILAVLGGHALQGI